MAERLEGELGEEQPSFIKGCPDQWYELSEPAAPLVVSLDGGYVHARSKTQRKDGSFEVIVGKSTTGDGATTRFGLVSGYDTKPRRRLFEVLQAQGLQMNQAITFLTDGGDTVRDLTEGHSPQTSHILDWFHPRDAQRAKEGRKDGLSCSLKRLLLSLTRNRQERTHRATKRPESEK